MEEYMDREANNGEQQNTHMSWTRTNYDRSGATKGAGTMDGS